MTGMMFEVVLKNIALSQHIIEKSRLFLLLYKENSTTNISAMEIIPVTV